MKNEPSSPSLLGIIGTLTCPGFWLSMYCHVTQESKLPFCLTFLIRSQAVKMRWPAGPRLFQSFLSPSQEDLAKQGLSV